MADNLRPTDDSRSGPLPRVTIQFCTQCKWMLRAAYFAQELLSTFSTSLGEVALQPSTGGVFVVEIFHVDAAQSSPSGATIQRRVLWDRKADGGFPETKELKRRVRDVIEPNRDLGHVDRDHSKPKPKLAAPASESSASVLERLDEAGRQRAQKVSGAGDAGGYPGGAEAAATVARDEARKGVDGGNGSVKCEDCE